MRVVVVGGGEGAAGRLAAALAAEGLEATPLDEDLGAGAEPGGPRWLAVAILELERRLIAATPQAVVLVDDGDAALAAALVATKLGIPLGRGGEAASGDDVNSRLLDRLAGPPLAEGRPDAVAEIAARLRAGASSPPQRSQP